VLRVLAARVGEVVSKDDLIDIVRGRTAVNDDSPAQCISDIRRALDPDGHRLLRTVRGKGYRLTPRSGEEMDAGRGRARRRPLLAGMAVVATAVLVGLAHLTVPDGTVGMADGEPHLLLSVEAGSEHASLGAHVRSDLTALLARDRSVALTRTVPDYVLRVSVEGAAGAPRLAAELADAMGASSTRRASASRRRTRASSSRGSRQGSRRRAAARSRATWWSGSRACRRRTS
jgi:hypothetical protein